ncbi:MAG TPA: HNH endonuclease [Acidimicrobiia bacterium]|nr:HNH endonuclease [Acidimicrobiia bacterium]
MELGSYSDDRLDELIIRAESEIATWRLVEMAAITEKRRRKSHFQDGYRTIVDWTAARADVSHQTARALCWTATRLGDAPEVAEALVSGAVSFHRAEQLARLPAEHRSGHEGYDIAGLRRLVAHHKRLTRRRERKGGNGFLVIGPGDELAIPFWGELPGLDARILEKAVDQKADEIIPPNRRLPVAERRALALVSIFQDSLCQNGSSEESVPVEVAVIVDARTAASTNAETGVSVLAGPRLGPGALEEILCHGIVEVFGITETGQPLNLGRRSRTVGRRMRRHVLGRDGGCTVEGCSSRYRLEIHHVTPWSHGGRTDADDLVTLCWFHHHVSVHREGLQIHRVGTSRIRLKRPR